ncbi:WD40-repeat-containing domain protein [Crepidotus variabilis]|uniref:WD40-repeat-containing domain protein n=1 Tax=Crepidotus variabilis TaxID=179855 RepID=A0A9P6EJY9_9AGAR|nr:WD40-repeat-containing domain protein [Crepidotus variabilis]
MSFKKLEIFPTNPTTTRGESTKLSSSKDKIVYASGRTVVIRDLKNPGATTIYSGHIQNTTVARISPSGYYCASADVTGKVNVWDVVGEDQILKGEYRVLSGRVNDLAWDGESKRIIAVGDGKEKFGSAFMMDTGSSTGEIIGHSKVINAVSIRHQRPFRAATAGDDTQIIFHTGAPYKYEKTISTHTKFVQDIQYAASGDHFVSVGSDSKIFLYDGKTGDTVAEFTDSPHKGTIFAASWSPDSKQIFTSSGDRTVKLWDAQTQKAITTWTLGTAIEQQQVGNTWNGDNVLVSLSISGDLNVFDPRTGDKPVQILTAPQKAVNAITPVHEGSTSTFLTGTADGRVYAYNGDQKSSTVVEGKTHSNNVSGLATAKDGKVYSIGFDDHVREIDADGSSFVPAAVATSTQPKSIAIAGDGTVFVGEIGIVEAFRSNQKVLEQKPSYQPSAIGAGGSFVAIGGEDRKVRLNEWDGKALKELAVLEGNQGQVSALSFSPDGKYLASGDSSGKVILFDVQERKLFTSRWAHHSARINSFSWTEDSRHLASGSLDTHVYIWSTEKLMKNVPIKNAGPGGINGVLWLNGGKSPNGTGKLASTGFDGVVRIWEVKFHT